MRNEHPCGVVIMLDVATFPHLAAKIGYEAAIGAIADAHQWVADALSVVFGIPRAEAWIAPRGPTTIAAIAPLPDRHRSASKIAAFCEVIRRGAGKDIMPLVHFVAGTCTFSMHGRTLGEAFLSAEADLAAAISRISSTFSPALPYHLSISDIFHAMTSRQIKLWHQPKVSLSTCDVVGYEALVRWEHPEFGLLMPSVFLPHVERYSISAALDTFLVQTTLSEVCARARTGANVPPVSVNLDGDILHSGGIVPIVENFLSSSDSDGFSPSMVEFEVTERTTIRSGDVASRQLRRLRELGFSIAIDDFGSGGSNIQMLTAVPATIIKTDRSLIECAGGDGRPTLLKLVVDLASAYGCSVVIEGIETQKQYEIAVETGAEMGQGFYFGRASKSALSPANNIALAS